MVEADYLRYAAQNKRWIELLRKALVKIKMNLWLICTIEERMLVLINTIRKGVIRRISFWVGEGFLAGRMLIMEFLGQKKQANKG